MLILDALLGVVLRGVFAAFALWLIWKVVQLASRNYISLSGMYIPRDEMGYFQASTTCGLFLLRVQNLESLPLEEQIQIKISCIPDGDSQPFNFHESVKVIAGARSFQGSVEVDTRGVHVCLVTNGLPAFDTWTVLFAFPTSMVNLSVSTVNQPDALLLDRVVGVEVWPTKLSTSKADRKEAKVAGPTKIPLVSLPILVSFVALFGLWLSPVVAAMFDGLEPSQWNLLSVNEHWHLFLGMIVVIWGSFALLRRPAQPIVPGYREESYVSLLSELLEDPKPSHLDEREPAVSLPASA